MASATSFTQMSSSSSSSSSQDASGSKRVTGKMLKLPGIDSFRYTSTVRQMFGVGGLCCAFAMDWAKSRLSARVYGKQNPYRDKARLERLGENQSLQGGSGLEGVAKAFGLVMAHEVDWTRDIEGKETPENFGFRLELIYYISMSFVGTLEGHGFAIDCRGVPWLADSGAGIYECAGLTAGEVFRSHLDLLIPNFRRTYKLEFEEASCYRLGLMAQKPFVPVTKRFANFPLS